MFMDFREKGWRHRREVSPTLKNTHDANTIVSDRKRSCMARQRVCRENLLCVQCNDVQQDFSTFVHALHGGALSCSVEVEAAGAQIGARQAHPA